MKTMLPGFNTFSSNDVDNWFDCPDDIQFVDGLKVGDTYELLAGWKATPVTYRVTKAPDDATDDYCVELVHPSREGNGETPDVEMVRHPECANHCERALADSEAPCDHVCSYQAEAERNAMVGASIYRGNTVSYMYSKCDNYKAALAECFEVLFKHGFKADGKIHIKDLIDHALTKLAAPVAKDYEPLENSQTRKAAELSVAQLREGQMAMHGGEFDQYRMAMCTAASILEAMLSVPPAGVQGDAARFQYLCEDMPDGPRKRERDALLDRMCVMTMASVRQDIDAAIEAQSTKGD